METAVTCIISSMIALLCIIPGLYYRKYYLDGKKKPENCRVLFTSKRVWLSITLVQITIGGIMIWLTLRYHPNWDAIVREQLLLHILTVIASVDIAVKRIPNVLTAAILCVWLLFLGVDIFHEGNFGSIGALLLRAGLGLLAGGGIMLLCMLLSRGGLGAGDVKLFAVLGLHFGMLGILNVLFYTCLLTAVASIILLVARKMKWKDTIPMSPFILGACLVYDVLL